MKQILVALALLFPCRAPASMMAMRELPLSAVIASLEKRNAGEDARLSLALAKLDRDVLGETVFRVPASDQTEEQAILALQPADLAGHVANSVRGQADPGKAIPEPLKAEFRGACARLEKMLPADVWPWLQLQLGQKTEAKAALAALYGKEFDSVMLLTQAVSGLGHTPLTEASYLHALLRPLATPAEAVGLDDKLQKMKVHVSNLPQAAIST